MGVFPAFSGQLHFFVQGVAVSNHSWVMCGKHKIEIMVIRNLGYAFAKFGRQMLE